MGIRVTKTVVSGLASTEGCQKNGEVRISREKIDGVWSLTPNRTMIRAGGETPGDIPTGSTSSNGGVMLQTPKKNSHHRTHPGKGSQGELEIRGKIWQGRGINTTNHQGSSARVIAFIHHPWIKRSKRECTTHLKIQRREGKKPGTKWNTYQP